MRAKAFVMAAAFVLATAAEAAGRKTVVANVDFSMDRGAELPPVTVKVDRLLLPYGATTTIPAEGGDYTLSLTPRMVDGGAVGIVVRLAAPGQILTEARLVLGFGEPAEILSEGDQGATRVGIVVYRR